MMAIDLDERAHAVSAFRVLANGTGRQYSAVWFPKRPRGGIEQLLRQARAFGNVRPQGWDAYALLDILDENGDIIQDYTIPNAKAFRWWYRKLDLRVEDEGSVWE